MFRSSLPFCKLIVVFSCKRRLADYFKFKDRVSRTLTSNVVYKFECGSCNASYIGLTTRHLPVRVSEHISISARTGNQVKTQPSAISDHLLFTCEEHRPSLDDFKVLSHGRNEFDLAIKESLWIHRDRPTLNINVSSTPLYLRE